MLKEIIRLAGRFLFTLTIVTIASVHTLIIAVPDASRPGAVAAAIISALFIAMFDIGVFRVDIDSDYINLR